MRISKIAIRNFRSIVEADIGCSNFNIFVGQNNCGKTNFFEAVEWFFNGTGRSVNINDLRFERNPSNDFSVSITFEDAQSGAAKMKNEKNRTSVQKALGESNTITITRTCNNPKKRICTINGEEVNPGTGFDKALNDFLPKFEYIHTKQYHDSVSKYQKSTPVGIMLSEVISTLLEENKKYIELQAKFNELFESDDSEIKAEFDILGGKVKGYLSRQFPDCTDVKFEVSTPEFDDLLKKFDTSIDDGIKTSADEKGDGMQRALMLAIIQAYADFRKERDDVNKTFLFFIDEAELHLHPTAQRNLKEVLLELAKKSDQVFINTHSSVFVADEDEKQCIFKVQKIEKKTEFEIVTDTNKHYLVYDLLGGSPADLLLPRNFLIVEGRSEQDFLRKIIERFYPDKPTIQIIKANGDIDQTERSINAIEKLFSPLNESLYREKTVIVCDKRNLKNKQGVKDFLGRFNHLKVNKQYYELSTCTIEEYYPDYDEWQKSPEKVKKMTGKQKISLARKVANCISQEQFENEMKTIFDALNKAWEAAY